MLFWDAYEMLRGSDKGGMVSCLLELTRASYLLLPLLSGILYTVWVSGGLSVWAKRTDDTLGLSGDLEEDFVPRLRVVEANIISCLNF